MAFNHDVRKYYRAICVHLVNGEIRFARYATVDKRDNKLLKFQEFARNRFPGLLHINYYEKYNGAFVRQERFAVPPKGGS